MQSKVDPAEWLLKYGDYLFRYALSRVRDPDVAEEVVQEAFVAGLSAAAQYSGKGAERAWLLGILKRKIIDHFRRRGRTSAIGLIDLDGNWVDSLFDRTGHWKADPRFLGTQPGDAMEKAEFWAAVRDCIGKLPQRQADVFVLRTLDRTESDEICKELEISSSNLWVLLHRARLQLAKCLQGRWQNERSG